MQHKTTTTGKMVERLCELPQHTTVVQWGMIADKPVRKSRNPVNTVGKLIHQLSRLPKSTRVEQIVIKMMDRLQYPLIIEYGIVETLYPHEKDVDYTA